jgi:hypothetical protein
MKIKVFLPLVVCLAVLGLSTIPAQAANVITFDELSDNGSGTFFFNANQGYKGLTWNDIAYNNAILSTNVLPHLFPGAPTNGLSGAYYGMVSASNVALAHGSNSVIPNSEILSPGTNFDFLSAYLTGYWNSNVNIEVQGFRGVNLLYDTSVVASATAPTLFTFNYLNIDRLYFNSYGGEPAFGIDDGGVSFVMDNLSIEFVPEPSTVLLTCLGALTLCVVLRRRRA